jgi:molybdate transport system substrate-binding protein
MRDPHRRIGSFVCAIAIIATASLLIPCSAFGAELVVMSSVAARSIMDELGPRFERDSGIILHFRYGTAAALQHVIEYGARFDVAVLTPPVMSTLIAENRMSDAGQATFASSLIAVAVKHGATKPDISTREMFVQTLLKADKISYAKDGASGQYFQRVLKQLNLEEALKDKLLPMTGSKEIEAVADGLATLGVQLISEILPIRGADLVGPFPGDLQNSTELKIAVSAEPKSADLARQFIAFATSSAAADVIRSKGMIPP